MCLSYSRRACFNDGVGGLKRKRSISGMSIHKPRWFPPKVENDKKQPFSIVNKGELHIPSIGASFEVKFFFGTFS